MFPLLLQSNSVLISFGRSSTFWSWVWLQGQQVFTMWVAPYPFFQDKESNSPNSWMPTVRSQVFSLRQDVNQKLGMAFFTVSFTALFLLYVYIPRAMEPMDLGLTFDRSGSHQDSSLMPTTSGGTCTSLFPSIIILASPSWLQPAYSKPWPPFSGSSLSPSSQITLEFGLATLVAYSPGARWSIARMQQWRLHCWIGCCSASL